MKIRSSASRAIAAFVIGGLLVSPSLWAQDVAMMAHEGPVDEDPNMFAMVGDLFVARPIGLVLTVGGAAVWLVSLPFTLLAGNASGAAETLMLGPGEQTFMRCLGCRQSGYTYADIEQNKKRKAAQVED